jgi:hypothetical protein
MLHHTFYRVITQVLDLTWTKNLRPGTKHVVGDSCENLGYIGAFYISALVDTHGLRPALDSHSF